MLVTRHILELFSHLRSILSRKLLSFTFSGARQVNSKNAKKGQQNDDACKHQEPTTRQCDDIIYWIITVIFISFNFTTSEFENNFYGKSNCLFFKRERERENPKLGSCDGLSWDRGKDESERCNFHITFQQIYSQCSHVGLFFIVLPSSSSCVYASILVI